MIRSCDRCDTIEEDDNCILVTIHIHHNPPIPKILCATCREAFKWWLGETTKAGMRIPRDSLLQER